MESLFQIDDYITEISTPDGCKWIGKTVAEVEELVGEKMTLFGFIRKDDKVLPPNPDGIIQEGCRYVVKADPVELQAIDRGTRPASVHRDAASHRQPEGGEHRLHRGHRDRRLAAAGAHPDVPPASQRQHDDAHGCGASKQAHPQAAQGGGFSRRRRFAAARQNPGDGRHHHRSQSAALGRAGAKGGYVLTDWFVSGDICGSHRFEHDWVPNDHCLLGCCAGLHSLRDFAAPRYLPGGGMANHRPPRRDDSG